MEGQFCLELLLLLSCMNPGEVRRYKVHILQALCTMPLARSKAGTKSVALPGQHQRNRHSRKEKERYNSIGRSL
jgi:hypothetical protein